MCSFLGCTNTNVFMYFIFTNSYIMSRNYQSSSTSKLIIYFTNPLKNLLWSHEPQTIYPCSIISLLLYLVKHERIPYHQLETREVYATNLHNSFVYSKNLNLISNFYNTYYFLLQDNWNPHEIWTLFSNSNYKPS